MKISVIVPTHNNSTTLKRCIDSIFANDYSNIEVIVIENGSTDNTADVITELKKDYPSLILRHTDIIGVSHARNIGLDIAAGEIITFCDADDFVERDAFSAVVKILENYDADIVFSYFAEVFPDETRIPGSGARGEKVKTAHFRQMVLNDGGIGGFVFNKFYRSRVLSDADGSIRFDEGITHCEDLLFNMRILKREELSVYSVGSKTYNYMMTAESATRDVTRLWDSDGKLKYLPAVYKVRELYSDDRKIRSEVGYKILTLAVENYSSDLPETYRAKLIEEIKRNLKYALFVRNKTRTYIVTLAIRIILGRI